VKAERYHEGGTSELHLPPMLTRPDPTELDAAYQASLERVPDGDVLEIMAREICGHEIHHECILVDRYLT